MTVNKQVWMPPSWMNGLALRWRNFWGRHYVVVGLAPHSVCAMLIKGWGTPRVVAQVERDVGTRADWSACVQAVQDLLTASDWQRLDCCVVVPEQWVRWATVAWKEEDSPYQSVQEVRAQIESLLTEPELGGGDGVAKPWTAVANASNFGQTQLGAAVPQGLLDGLAEAVGVAGLRLVSCQSAHALAWNRWRSYDIDGRQLALHIRASRAQVFCTVDVGTLTIAWRYRPAMDLAQGTPDFYKLAERTFDGVRTVPVSSGVVVPVREIEQQLAALQIEGAVVTVVVVGRRRRGSMSLIRQGAEFWHVIDATNAGGMSGGEVLCHLLSPRKREGLLSFLGLEFRSAKDGVVIDFVRGGATSLVSAAAALPMRVALWGTAFLLMGMVFGLLQTQMDAWLGRADATASQVVKRPMLSAESVEGRAAVAVSANLNWPWARFFALANLGDRPEVALRGVTLGANGTLRVSGDSRNLKAAQAFFQSLEAKHAGASVFAVSEQRMYPQNKNYMVHFDASVSLQPEEVGLLAVRCVQRTVC